MAQVPRAEKGRKCPFWQKDMALVCHTCPLWTNVKGKHPQSNEDIDRWDCAIAWAPILTIEVAQQAKHAGAATESLRNEMVESGRRMTATIIQLSNGAQSMAWNSTPALPMREIHEPK